jgi:phospholipid N-methyltransferase
MALKEQTRFLSEFLKKPGSVGAVAPSSRSLARKMVEWIDWPNVRTVIEYGPGTGAFTGPICDCLHAPGRLLAIELNPQFAQSLESRYPDVRVYRESVANVEAVCREEGIGQVDAIVSGLPWAVFGEKEQARILAGMTAVLKPGGQFVTFAYLQGMLLPAARRFRARLGGHFSQISRSRTAWRNFPPAFVYRCRK